MIARLVLALAATTLGAVGTAGTAGPVHAQTAPELPADEASARERLNESPRHGEWIYYDAGDGDRVNAWVVHPERDGPAPVVVVIHEIYGLTDWIRAVADHVAAEGYIAIAPDLLSGKGPDGGGTAAMADRQAVVQAIRDLDESEVDRRLRAAAGYGMGLPSAAPRVATVGFCWGGSTSFRFATEWDELDGAVVYYGGSPATEALSDIEAPVLGLYGGDDERVNSTIPQAEAEMERLGKPYTPVIYEGAGHGFLRQQDGREGANMEATRQAWPRTVAFFREVLGG